MAPSPRFAPLLWVAVVAPWCGACSAGGAAGGGATESVPPRSAAVASVENASVADQAVTPTPTQPPSSSTANRASTTTSPSTTTTAVATTTTSATSTTVSTIATSTTVAPPPSTTSCTTVAHIGDSTSVGLFEAAYLPAETDALPAQYTRVGVLALYTEVSGGRSTTETRGGHENAFDTVLRLREMGYRGCWVVTIGTNDAANVSIGGVPDLAARLDRMMVLFGTDPVLWVDAVTRLDDGPYADVNMQAWNAVLDDAELRFPTLHVFRWSDVAVDEWFVSDGIHYTSDGSAWRAHVIADALAAAFPAGGA